MSSASAPSSGSLFGERTSTRPSLEPDTVRPSGYSEDLGMKATAFMKEEAFDIMVSSKCGGVSELSAQSRTVVSLEAETIFEGEGNVTPRTYVSSVHRL